MLPIGREWCGRCATIVHSLLVEMAERLQVSNEIRRLRLACIVKDGGSREGRAGNKRFGWRFGRRSVCS